MNENDLQNIENEIKELENENQKNLKKEFFNFVSINDVDGQYQQDANNYFSNL